ncbi:MAG TPA: peptidyl-prolyl cis-trans isomerase [Pyrinomonadaceae bacterium]|nr:peptidyl-prolyl cis-trans isomerase [Pyrinomonadaceae bacterium]HNU07162.1 peptidyl-prolyl cis-trans isomerase [Pyrinomonadaceae bacterium]
MTRFIAAIVTVLFISAFSVFAQETELKVIDEVVAQVNDGVITLSRVRREMKGQVDMLVEQGKTRDVANAEVQSKEGEIIAKIIEEELLLQKGKELGVESEVDAEINRRFLEIMKQQNFKTLDQLYKAMGDQGLNPQDVREAWRKQYTMEYVVNREVFGKTLWGWSAKEVKAYYEKHKEKFFKPEIVTLSEIFMSFAGRDEAAVREKAKTIVAELRKGGDFAKFAVENSDREDVKQSNGSIGPISANELKRACEKCVAPIGATAKGGVTDPIELVEGIEIFRVDDRKEASKESVFDEADVRRAMTIEVLDTKRKDYMADLRKDSYIRINDTYRPMVSPYFFNEAARTEVKKPAK